MAYFIQEILNGVSLGLVYALMAAGLSVIFGIMDIPNFAHGELFILGPILGAALLASGIPFVAAIVIAVILVGILGGIVYQALLHPLRRKGLIPVVLVTVGLALILQYSVLNIWGSEPMKLTPPFGAWRISLAGITITSAEVVLITSGLIILGGLGLFINKSRIGEVFRAVFQDSDAAELSGINSHRVFIGTFVIGSILAAIGGVLYSFQYPVYPTVADLVVVKAFVVVIVGGAGDFRGAIAAGVLLGIGEALVTSYFATSMRDIMALALVVVVLLFRPQGIFRRSSPAI